MHKWYVKEFGKLTGVSVRTLHYYDQVGLFKPSLRLPNGYRLYTEADLVKLQLIMALKFFGLDLKQIKKLVQEDVDTLAHLRMQRQQVREQVASLQDVNKALDAIIHELEQNRSIHSNSIIQLIGVYRMTQELKKTWAGKVYTEEQLTQMAEVKQRYSAQEQADYEKRWVQLTEKVKAHLDEDPYSIIGQQLAKEWMDLTNEVYGDYPGLKRAMSSAYQENKIPGAPFNPKLWNFIEKAVARMLYCSVYSEEQLKLLAEIQQRYSVQEMTDYKNRWNKLVEKVKAHIDQEPASAIRQQLEKEWVGLVNEVYSDYPEIKEIMISAYRTNKIPQVSFAAKHMK